MRLERRSSFGWPATAAGYAPCSTGLVVHYDGSNQGLAGKPHGACQEYWRNTRRFHMSSARGWLDIGYSFGVCPHGIVFEGRGWQRQQAAQPGGNSTWTSCTFMSGDDEDPTDAQVNAFRELRAWLRGKGLGAAIRGHRDFISTSCPGGELYRMVTSGALTGAPTKEDDMPTVDEFWKHPISIPEYGQEEHPGVKTIPAEGLLRGAEIKAHNAREKATEAAEGVLELRARLDAQAVQFDEQAATLAEIKALLTAPKES